MFGFSGCWAVWLWLSVSVPVSIALCVSALADHVCLLVFLLACLLACPLACQGAHTISRFTCYVCACWLGCLSRRPLVPSFVE